MGLVDDVRAGLGVRLGLEVVLSEVSLVGAVELSVDGDEEGLESADVGLLLALLDETDLGAGPGDRGIAVLVHANLSTGGSVGVVKRTRTMKYCIWSSLRRDTTSDSCPVPWAV